LAKGYCGRTAGRQVMLLGQLSGWMQTTGLAAHGLTPPQVAAFLDFRRAQGATYLLSTQAAVPLLGYLRKLGVVPTPTPVVPDGPVEHLVAGYRQYLAVERGLAPYTVAIYGSYARMLLADLLAGANRELATVRPQAVTAFVVEQVTCRQLSAARQLLNAVRGLCRYLHLEGHTAVDLSAAVPGVRGPVTCLPRGLDPEVVLRVLEGIDRSRDAGRRDYAIIVLLLRLGLRASEVAGLRLDDLDWPAGQIVIAGKGHRSERLPLPVDVGEAVVAYLQAGRPTNARHVFLTRCAPTRGLTGSTVAAVVNTAFVRQGLPVVGSHRLRHTAATGMLRSGASLAEVSQVLRHRSAASSALYAKVDHDALRALARPWPGAQS
jgi:integrase/recombinase XerD